MHRYINGHQYLIEKGLEEMDEFYAIVYETEVISIPIEQRADWIKKLYPSVQILYAKNPPSQYGLDEKNITIQTNYLKQLIKDLPVTHFYNSEEYGKYVARDLGILERQVDKKRTTYPISATKIREEIEEYRNYIEPTIYQEIRWEKL